MAKITAHKKVYWDSGGRQMTGKVKQVLSNNAIVIANNTQYIVSKNKLRLHPTGGAV